MRGNSIFGVISLTLSTLVDDISRCSVNWVASADCVRVCDVRETPVPISIRYVKLGVYCLVAWCQVL